MKKYILKILLFFIIVAIIDVAFGYACRFLNSHSKGGYTKSQYYIAKECSEELLVFGSSRAVHHYVPTILSDSLGLTTYNCGIDGNGILFLYSRLLMVTNRYTPKVIIYDVNSTFDMKTDDFSRYLKCQKAFCNVPGVMEVIDTISATERYKLNSKLYQFNGSFISLLSDYARPTQVIGEGGYMPLYGIMQYEPKNREPVSAMQWNQTKKFFFKKFYETCKKNGITFIVAYSPSYNEESSSIFNEVSLFCKENNIPLLDYYADPLFSKNKDYFIDSVHMNDEGATEYTKTIVKEIRKYL